VGKDERTATSTSTSGKESEDNCVFFVSLLKQICHKGIGRYRENGLNIRQILSASSLAEEHHC
jgi:hypothetical protein